MGRRGRPALEHPPSPLGRPGAQFAAATAGIAPGTPRSRWTGPRSGVSSGIPPERLRAGLAPELVRVLGARVTSLSNGCQSDRPDTFAPRAAPLDTLRWAP